MKLKSGVLFNEKDHSVTGFVSQGDGVDLDNGIKSLLSGSKKDESLGKVTGIASYVNQWRFRSMKNRVRNLDFSFVKGKQQAVNYYGN